MRAQSVQGFALLVMITCSLLFKSVRSASRVAAAHRPPPRAGAGRPGPPRAHERARCPHNECSVQSVPVCLWALKNPLFRKIPLPTKPAGESPLSSTRAEVQEGSPAAHVTKARRGAGADAKPTDAARSGTTATSGRPTSPARSALKASRSDTSVAASLSPFLRAPSVTRPP